jgi:poly(3-hydroxybutyrate) depolymerase
MQKKIILSIFVILLSVVSYAQEMTTMVYHQYDSTALSLDFFKPKNTTQKAFPLVIYVHGGGFSGGNRTGGHNLGKYLAEKGIATASISYTLSQKGKGFGCNVPQLDKIRTMQLAASETWQATQFLLSRAAELGFNPSQVFLAGSSAGAEAVLHTAYLDRVKYSLHQKPLDANFKYAGLISGAGAIIDLGLITKENALPSMFFHGDADPLVPFNVASHHFCSPDSPGWMMLFGSSALATHLSNLNVSNHIYSFTGGGRVHAGHFFYQNQEPIATFIQDVLAKKTFFYRTVGVSVGR